MDADNLDLLSNSTIISLFLMIYRIISSILVEIINIKALLLFQFIFGMIVSIFLIILFTIGCCCLIGTIDLVSEQIEKQLEKQLKKNLNN